MKGASALAVLLRPDVHEKTEGGTWVYGFSSAAAASSWCCCLATSPETRLTAQASAVYSLPRPKTLEVDLPRQRI